MMVRFLRHLLLGLALVVNQQAAQLHWLSHIDYDLAVAQTSGKSAPPVGHPFERCLAFHAVGSALTSGAHSVESPCVAPSSFAQFLLAVPYPPRIVFDSRAPPTLS